jgi:hypothetical protein
VTRNEIVEVVRVNPGARFRVTFADGVTQAIAIGPVDDEGFLHSGPEGVDPDHYWTRFESVALIEPECSKP